MLRWPGHFHFMKRFAALAVALLFIAGAYRLGQENPLPEASLSKSSLDFSLVDEVWQVVSQNYLRIDEVDQEKLKYGLAKGLVAALGDQHSSFMDPQEAEAFFSSLQGDFQGIGAELKIEDGAVVIISPLPGSPAEKAGLRQGDVILKVNGEYLGTVTDLFGIVMRIRGPEGSQVSLTVLPKDDAQPREMTITRESIHINGVAWEDKQLDGQGIAYLRISSFTEHIGEEFSQALQEITDKGYEKLVIDLRFNGGGFLEGAVDILSHFVEVDKPVVLIRNQDQKTERLAYKTSPFFTGEIVVLVNDTSASASEIVAGALQDYKKAKIIGTKTFGKGSVQEVHPFSDQSMIRLTIAEWLTPLGKSIDRTGIDPDQLVELDYEAFKDGQDNQLEAALQALTLEERLTSR